MNDIDNQIHLDRFTPKPFQECLFDAVENKGYKRVLLIWPRRCLSGDSHITMADGSFKFLKDIAQGDKILSWDGSKFVPDIVKNAWSAGVKDSYRVKGSGSSLEIISSGDHKFAHTSCTGNRVQWDGIQQIGKYRRLLQYNGIDTATNLSETLLPEFLGYILSDGSHTVGQQPKFTNSNPHIIQRVIHLAKELFDGIYCSVTKKGNGSDLRFTNGTRGGGYTPNPVKELLKQNDLLTPKKEQRLPVIAWQWNEKQILHFIAGVIAGDGNLYCRKKGYKAADTGHIIPPSSEITISCGPSNLYAWDLYWLLRKIEIFPQCPFKERDSNWKIKIAKHYNIKKLLSVRIWGKEDKQEKMLAALKGRYKSPQLFKGSIRTGFKRAKSDPIEMFDIETENHHNFIANGYVVHNSGKDIAAFNLCIKEALKKRMVIWYIFPTYSQGKKALWDSITNDGYRFLDYIPPELIYSKNSQEMKIVFANGSLLQVIGSDNYDALVGANPQFCVFSEYALQDPRAFQYISPMLRANLGTAIFLSTVRGKNHLYALYNIALNNPEWFVQKLTVEDTQHIDINEIEREIESGEISNEMARQEYWNSWDQGVDGAFYAHTLNQIRLTNQITQVPWESNHPVHTAWDLGMNDDNVIIWFQVIGQTIRIIDCYADRGHGLDFYARIIHSKPYTYGKHFAPHDIAVREQGTGVTRLQTARELGIPFRISQKASLLDGIEAVRAMLPKCWIDEKNCKDLIVALENYRREFNSKTGLYSANPVHDRHSHYCFTADTLVLTDSGMRPIINIRETDKVMTLEGWQSCTKAIKTQTNAKVVEVLFQDGTKVRCTPEHTFLTVNGWRSAKNLKKGSRIRTLSMPPRNYLEKPTRYAHQGSILKDGPVSYTEMYGPLRLVQYLINIISITKMEILPIITSGILNAFQFMSTCLSQNQTIKGLVTSVEKGQRNGMEAPREKNGTSSTHRSIILGKMFREEKFPVDTAVKNLKLLSEKDHQRENSAMQTAKPLLVESVSEMKETFDVYDIGVPGTGHFTLGNGAIVHNCDATRYLALNYKLATNRTSAEDLDANYRKALYRDQPMDLPPYHPLRDKYKH